MQLVEVVWPDAESCVRQVAEKVAEKVVEAVRPDPPFTLQTSDGEVITGFVVLDHGRALLFFGTRQPAASRPVYHAPERTYPELGYRERKYDDDPPLWSSSPFAR